MNIEETVIQCAATAYGVDVSKISVNTVIREELANQSLMMISFISEIEDELGASIELREVGKLITIGDFVNRVKELLA